jgi:hypothetical protein
VLTETEIAGDDLATQKREVVKTLLHRSWYRLRRWWESPSVPTACPPRAQRNQNELQCAAATEPASRTCPRSWVRRTSLPAWRGVGISPSIVSGAIMPFRLASWPRIMDIANGCLRWFRAARAPRRLTDLVAYWRMWAAPPMNQVCPLIHSASSESRKAVMAARSAGRPRRVVRAALRNISCSARSF